MFLVTSNKLALRCMLNCTYFPHQNHIYSDLPHHLCRVVPPSYLRGNLMDYSAYCCAAAKSCLILCNPMDCSMPVSPSFTIFQRLLIFMSSESMMPPNHLILCCPPSSFAFNLSQPSGSLPVSLLFPSGGHSIGASSVLPMNIQG